MTLFWSPPATCSLIAFAIAGLPQYESAPLRLIEDLKVELKGLDGAPVPEAQSVVVTRLGTILVSIPTEQRILVLDSTATTIGSFGGKGAGPGEFVEMTAMQTLGDTIVVTDPSLRRFSLLVEKSRLGFLGTIPMGRDLSALLSDSMALVEPPLLASRQFADSNSAWPLTLSEWTGRKRDTLLRRGLPRQSVIIPGPKRGVHVLRVPELDVLDDTPFWRVGPGSEEVLLVEPSVGGDRSRYRVTVISPTGARRFQFSASRTLSPVPQGFAERIIDELTSIIKDRMGSADVARTAIVKALKIPSHFPSVSSAFLSEQGDVWLGSRVGDKDEWTILSRKKNGVPTQVSLLDKPGVALKWADGRRAWGISNHSDGKAFLHRFRLE